MTTLKSRYGISRVTHLGFAEAVARVKDLLGTAGFGVLCEINIAERLKERIHVSAEPYVILGVCNPLLAYQALGIEPDLGLLLPCNVIVRQHGSQVVVAAIDARALITVTGNKGLEPIAGRVASLLADVVNQL